jgi:phytanoyl-CoA hydroxylase
VAALLQWSAPANLIDRSVTFSCVAGHDQQLRRHPWNRDFTWLDHSGPFRAVTADQARQFDEQGYFVLEAAVAPDAIAELRDEIDERERRLEELLRQREGERFSIAEAGAITFATNLALRSAAIARFATQRLFGDLCADLVGPEANLYWDQAVYKKPEKPRRFPWHQDNGYTFVRPQQYLTCWVALTDATVENGCPQVAPGLHRRGTLEHRYVEPLGWECLEDPPEVVPAPVGAGGIVVFSSLTPHLTGPNTTGDVRKAYILQYSPADAVILRGDPGEGEPTSFEACDDPTRYLPLTRGGAPVGG